jgi:hypothetical protein
MVMLVGNCLLHWHIFHILFFVHSILKGEAYTTSSSDVVRYNIVGMIAAFRDLILIISFCGCGRSKSTINFYTFQFAHRL